MTRADAPVAENPADPHLPRKPHWAIRRLWWPLRNVWRSLTSMRTALVLLFLLALAAIPGACCPSAHSTSRRR